MALLRVNACGTEPVLHASPQPLGPALCSALARDPGPVTILLHGYRYRPGRDCPHEQIFALAPNPRLRRVISWPRHLGYGQESGDPGLAICFGWDARGTVAGAYDRAARAGEALARLVTRIKAQQPSRPIHVMGHSMGARVALSALPHASAGALDLLILLSAAEYAGAARAALETPAGRAAQVLHVTSRENDIYDVMLECLVSPATRGDRPMGVQMTGPGNFRNLWLDDARTLSALADLGHRVAPPQKRICHWSSYLRPGVFGVYRALLNGSLSPAALDTALPALQAHPRWSRLALIRPPALPTHPAQSA